MTTAPPTPPRAPDWGLGRYELTAAQLLPAAETLVAHSAIVPGERVADVGCGTGNAALLAAARGARVTAVDPAARLFEVARREGAARGLDATFVYNPRFPRIRTGRTWRVHGEADRSPFPVLF